MFFGNDEQGSRIYIDDVQEGAKYYCPACNEPLIPKINGTVVAHHYRQNLPDPRKPPLL